MKKDYFININDIGKVIIEYIGSPEYKQAMEAQESPNGFLGGIGIAGVVILSKCPKYILSMLEEKEIK